MTGSAEARLGRLVETGELKFVYVLGLARSSSTIVCRMLGTALDGAVFEPATPVSPDRRGHYARTILRAFGKARKAIGSDRPVSLAIKDLSLFLDDPLFLETAAAASHVVFTVREPVAQYASLRRQLAGEFAFAQRVDAVLRHPFEALWMAWYFVLCGRSFIAETRAALPGTTAPLHRLATAGWNLRSFVNMERQIEKLGVPATVLDAGWLRQDPAGAEALLRRIAAPIARRGRRADVEVPGHSRMLPRSRWAAEALASRHITAATGRTAPPPAPDAFDAALLARVAEPYRRIRAMGMPLRVPAQ
ncbi:MAG TPA: hypothetical protein VFE52_07615 [Devosia sp.]|nr:hypothetical protein [Devosia sp.]